MRKRLIAAAAVLGCACAPAQQIAPNQIGPTATGDVLYGSGGGTARLPIGSVGYVLGVSSSNLPYWSPLTALGGAPSYQAAKCSVTLTSTTTTVTLTVTQGDLLLALAMENDHGVAAPLLPTLSDTQSNAWTTDNSGSYTTVGGTGTGNIAAHAFASASGSLTVTSTAAQAGGNEELMVVDMHAVGVDVAGISGIVVGSIPSVAATATLSGDLAVTLVLGNSSFGTPVIPPGALNYSGTDCGGDGLVGSFPALYPGLASTAQATATTGGNPNIATSAIFLVKSSLAYGGGTMSNPMYALGDTIYGNATGQPTRLASPTSFVGNYMLTEDIATSAVPVAPVWVSRPRVYTSSWTPAAATASSCVEQTHTVTGLVTNDVVDLRPPATLGTHLWIGSQYVSASNTLSVSFCADATGGTPPSGTWSILAMHP